MYTKKGGKTWLKHNFLSAKSPDAAHAPSTGLQICREKVYLPNDPPSSLYSPMHQLFKEKAHFTVTE